MSTAAADRRPLEGPRFKATPASALLVLTIIVVAVIAAFPLAWMTLHSLKTPQETMQVPPVWLPGAPSLDAYTQVAEVVSLGSLSAHADRGELLRWVGRMPAPPRRVFVTHGEPVAADSLRQATEEAHGWPCTVPEHLQAVEL